MPDSDAAGGDPGVNKIDKTACPYEADLLGGESETQISKHSVNQCINTHVVGAITKNII